MADNYRSIPSSYEESEKTRKGILRRFAEHVPTFDYLNRCITAPCLGGHEIWFYMGNVLLIKPGNRAAGMVSGDLEEIKKLEFRKRYKELYIETYEGYTLTTDV